MLNVAPLLVALMGRLAVALATACVTKPMTVRLPLAADGM
jgi:hypothetical protein